jgi:hypothetical protein
MVLGPWYKVKFFYSLKKPLTTIGLYDKSDTNVVIPLAMALILGVEGGEK